MINFRQKVNGGVQYVTTLMEEKAIEFLRTNAADQPFCLTVALKEPHGPWNYYDPRSRGVKTGITSTSTIRPLLGAPLSSARAYARTTGSTFATPRSKRPASNCSICGVIRERSTTWQGIHITFECSPDCEGGSMSIVSP